MPFESLNPNKTTKQEAKAPKPRSLPPPGEAFGANKDALKKKAKAKATPKKLTTPKKTPAVPKKTPAAPKKATVEPKGSAKKSTEGTQVEAGNGVTKPASAKKGRPTKRNPDSIFTHLLGESYSTEVFQSGTKKKQGTESVLVRKTANAKFEFDRLQGARTKKIPRKGMVKEVETEEVKASDITIMDLPKEARAKIWRHEVVCARGFIWPEEKRWREQPDLAMTCRKIRSEALAIYYGENVFAIKLTTNPTELGAIFVLEDWGRALEKTKSKPSWFSMIRRWAFAYSAPLSWVPVNDRIVTENNDFVISVAFSQKLPGGHFWDASVEVHREALCVMPSYEEFGTCKIKTLPAWLNGPVIAVTEAAKGGNITVNMVSGLLKQVQQNGYRVKELRCEELLPSVEPFCDG